MPTFFQITQPDISGLNDIDSAMIRNKFNFIGLLGIYFIVVMHIYIKNNGGIGFTFPANITGMIFIAIFIISILWQTRRFSSIQVSRALPYVVAGVVLLILPVFWSENPWRNTALLRFLVLLTGLCFYFLLLQCKLSRQDKIKILTILLLAVSTEALLGMVQYYVFAPDNFMRYNTLINRPYGIFQHVNVMASFMATGMVIALYLWQQNTISRRVRQLAGLVLVLTPCLLVLSGSRIGLLTVLIISPLQIRFILCNNRLSGFKAIGLIITGIAGAIFSLFVINGGRPLEQFSDVHDRLIAWEISLKMFSMKPLTGWGYGQFYASFLHTLHQYYPALDESYHLQHPHNEILFWSVEGGLPALAGIATGILGFLYSFCSSLRPAIPGFWQRLCNSDWLLPLPILMHMMVELPLYQSAAHGIMLLVLLCLCEKKRCIHVGINLLPYRLFIFWLARILLFYMLIGLWVSHKLVRVERQGLCGVATLESISLPNPLQSRLEWNRKSGTLMRDSQNQNKNSLDEYREWAAEYVRVKPDASIYKNLMNIAILQEESENYTYWKERGRYLFPANASFQ